MGRIAMSFVVLAIMVLGLKKSEGVTYNVGDTQGWFNPGNANSEVYDNWTEGKTFRVGDVLSFTWSGNHDVATTNTEANYDACTGGTNIISTSPALITLNATGKYYFFCTIPGHCMSGQKLDIDVLPASTTTPTTSSPPPPSSTTTPGTTTPTGSTTSPPPPSSHNSAASFAPIAALSAIVSVAIFSILS